MPPSTGRRVCPAHRQGRGYATPAAPTAEAINVECFFEPCSPPALGGDLRLRGTCEDAQVTRELERAVETAQDRLVASGYTDREAHRELTKAERQLAAARGEPWAEPIDLAAQWDTGAPLPHLVSNGSAAVLICYASAVDPNWDGTYATVVSPTDAMPAQLLEFTFGRCHATKFGGPNDEVISGHPLFGRGFEPYEPHIVHNSP